MSEPDTVKIPVALEALLANEAADAERQGTLTDRQLEIIYAQKWFKLFVPKSLGGLELGLVEALQLEEHLARIDGSLGWTVTLCSGATMFVGFLEKEVAGPLFENRQVCFGGSGMASGTAALIDDGYLVSGDWKYATGAPHLSVFTANCRLVQDDGTALLDGDGRELVRSFFFLPGEVVLNADWHTMGLVATAGHSFRVAQAKVPKNRCFHLVPEAATIDHLIYRYPFLPFAEATLAVNTLGMVQHFLSLCQKHMARKKMALGHDAPMPALEWQLLGTCVGQLADLRTKFYEVVRQSWEAVVLGTDGHEANALFGRVGQQSRLLVKEAREMAFRLFPYMGMYGADPSSDINRVWRDIFTASQHTLLR